MKNVNTHRHNPDRWTAPSPLKPLALLAEKLRHQDIWIRVGLCVAAILVLWIVTAGWAPGFPWRTRHAPQYFPHARVSFQYIDAIETSRARERVRRTSLVHYANDQDALHELREALVDRIFQIKDKAWEDLDDGVWVEFLGERFALDPGTDAPLPREQEAAGSGSQSLVVDDGSPPVNDPGGESGGAVTEVVVPASRIEDPDKRAFIRFINGLQNDDSLDAVKLGVETAMVMFVSNGLLENLEHDLGEGSSVEIMVHPLGNPDDSRQIRVSDVRIAEIAPELYKRLRVSLDNPENITDSQYVADRIYDWLRPRLPSTLTIDQAATERSLRRAEASTPPEYRQYTPGSPLDKRSLSVEGTNYIAANQPLAADDIDLLLAEHHAYVASLTFWEKAAYSLADWGMYIAAFALVCGYLYYRDRTLIDDLRQFSLLLGLFMITVILCWILSINFSWRAEIIPVCMFGMTISIAWHRELALLLTALVSLVFTVSHGFGIEEFVVLTATGFVASLLCGRIRSRTRLVYIGLVSAAVALPTTLGVGTMVGQPLGNGLFLDGVWFAGGALLAGLFMTALLPFLEQWFNIQTDISLLELGDANHPLLKQLVQRAPGTYNHSINVASMAEAAAEAIGANGLLCRVSAYFHDVGKMRKPEYFVENQDTSQSKHDDLVPTMSTLVIIAHVKEGAEMARRHHLPQPIIDIIEQHHGTTLVEYFYQQAARNHEGRDEDQAIEEADFRYPGPKPQTPEAAVMMLADAVESASRSLREPAPARLESLVAGISKKKLDDGQFDECSLTLEQLRTIETSLIKSLNAMYHARVKYPDQQPA